MNLPEIETVHLFPPLASELIGFLRDLEPSDWQKPTVLPTWSVKDIVAHLLFTLLQKLSGGRDGYSTDRDEPVGNGYDSLVRRITEEADAWAYCVRWLSPRVLVDLLEHFEPQLHAYLRTLDPHAQARNAVSWAGESRSLVWFDLAREFTERWHHQMQIRDAFEDLGIQTPVLYRPVMDTFMRALPYHYRTIEAPDGATVRVTILGEAGGSWFLVRTKNRWEPRPEPTAFEAAYAELRQHSAWKFLTRFGADTVPKRHVKVGGDTAVASHVLSMVCIMA